MKEEDRESDSEGFKSSCSSEDYNLPSSRGVTKKRESSGSGSYCDGEDSNHKSSSSSGRASKKNKLVIKVTNFSDTSPSKMGSQKSSGFL